MNILISILFRYKCLLLFHNKTQFQFQFLFQFQCKIQRATNATAATTNATTNTAGTDTIYFNLIAFFDSFYVVFVNCCKICYF